jgi:hypothetical protein
MGTPVNASAEYHSRRQRFSMEARCRSAMSDNSFTRRLRDPKIMGELCLERYPMLKLVLFAQNKSIFVDLCGL